MASYTLLPSSGDSRVRGSSHIDFKTATTGISAKAMRNDLSHLVGTVEDPATKKVQICLLYCYEPQPHKYSLRHSTQRCSPFSIFSRVIFPSAQRVKICESLLALTASILTWYIVTGIVLNHLPQTRSYPTTHFPNPLTTRTSASWRSSRSMAVLVHQWVGNPSTRAFTAK